MKRKEGGGVERRGGWTGGELRKGERKGKSREGRGGKCLYQVCLLHEK